MGMVVSLAVSLPLCFSRPEDGFLVPGTLTTPCHPSFCLLSSGGGKSLLHVWMGVSEVGRTPHNLQPGPGGSLRVHIL